MSGLANGMKWRCGVERPTADDGLFLCLHDRMQVSPRTRVAGLPSRTIGNRQLQVTDRKSGKCVSCLYSVKGCQSYDPIFPDEFPSR